MATERKWDGDGVPLAESNCAEIGSEEDKAARKAAAQQEPAWKGVGEAPGLLVWRIEQFAVVPWPKEEYGNFYAGDSYIILQTTASSDDGALQHKIFFWLGEKTSIDEMGTAAYKAVELDDLFDGEPEQSREVMGHESVEFRSLFPAIHYLSGGLESGFHRIGADAYHAKLFQVRRIHKTVVVKEVTLARESLNEGDCFILDAGTSIYVWTGQSASPFEKNAANLEAEHIEVSRSGKATATHTIDDRFWELLGGEGPIRAAGDATDHIAEAEIGEGVLYSVSDKSGSLEATEIGRGHLKAAMLDPTNVMLLDVVAEVFVWVGRSASSVESRSALRLAMNFLRTNSRPPQTPIHVLKDGHRITDAVWNRTFSD